MTLICVKMKLRAELIFIWKVSHLDSFETEAHENPEMAYDRKRAWWAFSALPSLTQNFDAHSKSILRNEALTSVYEGTTERYVKVSRHSFFLSHIKHFQSAFNRLHMKFWRTRCDMEKLKYPQCPKLRQMANRTYKKEQLSKLPWLQNKTTKTHFGFIWSNVIKLSVQL